MTYDEKIVALAELDGYTQHKGAMDYDGNPIPYTIYTNTDGIMFNSTDKTFSYLTSYDAIIPLIQKQAYSVTAFIQDELSNVNDMKYWLNRVTPMQMANALLTATGKMK